MLVSVTGGCVVDDELGAGLVVLLDDEVGFVVEALLADVDVLEFDDVLVRVGVELVVLADVLTAVGDVVVVPPSCAEHPASAPATTAAASHRPPLRMSTPCPYAVCSPAGAGRHSI